MSRTKNDQPQTAVAAAEKKQEAHLPFRWLLCGHAPEDWCTCDEEPCEVVRPLRLGTGLGGPVGGTLCGCCTLRFAEPLRPLSRSLLPATLPSVSILFCRVRRRLDLFQVFNPGPSLVSGLGVQVSWRPGSSSPLQAPRQTVLAMCYRPRSHPRGHICSTSPLSWHK